MVVVGFLDACFTFKVRGRTTYESKWPRFNRVLKDESPT